MIKAIIIDIDGTLANNSHRTHFIDSSQEASGMKNWKAYNEAMHKDTVNEWCRSLVCGMYSQGCAIIYMTGRHKAFSVQTLSLIEDNNLPIEELFMRPDGDNRDDSIVKLEIYEKLIKPNYEIVLCIDDRQRVVDMWRSVGLVCLQCAPGKF